MVLLRMTLPVQPSAASRHSASPSREPPARPRSASTSATPAKATPVPSQRGKVRRSDGTKKGSSISVKNGCMLNRIAARPALVMVSPMNSATCATMNSRLCARISSVECLPKRRGTFAAVAYAPRVPAVMAMRRNSRPNTGSSCSAILPAV
ncbi:hypothetical protein D3C83_11910 [compost metagenome]